VTPAAPWRVRAVNVQPGYRLSITCNDGLSGILDMSALVNSANAGIFASLKDAQLFQQDRPRFIIPDFFMHPQRVKISMHKNPYAFRQVQCERIPE
jgi:hypothetical protein